LWWFLERLLCWFFEGFVNDTCHYNLLTKLNHSFQGFVFCLYYNKFPFISIQIIIKRLIFTDFWLLGSWFESPDGSWSECWEGSWSIMFCFQFNSITKIWINTIININEWLLNQKHCITLNKCQKILKVEYNFEIINFEKLIISAIVSSLTNFLIKF
jgi:hypothetical protein